MPWLVLTVISFIYDLVQLITTINNNLGVNPTKMGINCGLIGCHMAIASWLILIVWSFRLIIIVINISIICANIISANIISTYIISTNANILSTKKISTNIISTNNISTN